MNADFPRIITLLRKEHGISQKQAASELGVSQALLSHYEKGIRECGLDFIVRAADYYNVSCDYLLGRSPEPTAAADKPPKTESAHKSYAGRMTGESASALVELSGKSGSSALEEAVNSYLMLAVYKMFRKVYFTDPSGNKRMFSVPDSAADALADAAMSLTRAEADAAAAGEPLDGSGKADEHFSASTGYIAAELEGGAELLACVSNAEKLITEKVLKKIAKK